MIKKFRDADDVFRDRDERERKEKKRDMITDIDDIIEGVVGKRKRRAKRKKKIVRPFWVYPLRILSLIILFIVIADLLLGSVWILRFLFRELF